MSIQECHYPLLIVGTLLRKDREVVSQFIQSFKAPVYLESTSGLRESPELQSYRIHHPRLSNTMGYPVDGIIRIGGVPTVRLWRDLEEMQGKIKVTSMSHLPFSGLSWGDVTDGPLAELIPKLAVGVHPHHHKAAEWLEWDRHRARVLQELFEEEPSAEPSLMHQLSREIPENALVYLGNSLPIREWDLAATQEQRGLKMFASRGVNGIDGQVSTFLGLCDPFCENWAILGDLTFLYDLAGPWILEQMPQCKVTLVVINNGGGKIFSRMFQSQKFQNLHQISMEPVAKLWKMDYERWTQVESVTEAERPRLIEIIPDDCATERFWKKYEMLEKKLMSCYVT